jgi:hypothetical protein
MMVALLTAWVFPACFNVEDPDDRASDGEGGSGTGDTDGDTDVDGDTDADGDPDPHYLWHTGEKVPLPIANSFPPYDATTSRAAKRRASPPATVSPRSKLSSAQRPSRLSLRTRWGLPT